MAGPGLKAASSENREPEPAGQHAAEHPGQEDLVEVEELPETDDDRGPAV